jgi:hypothetical protein
LFPIVPELFPQETTHQTRKGDPINGKEVLEFVQGEIRLLDLIIMIDINTGKR